MLRQIGDRFRQMRPNSVAIFASVEGEQVSLMGMASDDAVKAGVHAGNVVKEVAALIGGSGGGKPTMGQAGSKSAVGLDEALIKAQEMIQKQMKL